MVLIDEELALIDAAKEYINAFLSKFGEFLPFAMIMEGDDIFPLEHEENEQSSSAAYLIELYENYFNNELKDNSENKLGLLCIDIFTHSEDEDSKRNAIEYLLFGANYTKKVVQYYKILADKTVNFEEMVGWN